MSETPVGLSASPSLLLASSSPRRRDLLQQIGVRFSVLSVDIDESRCEGELPRDYVLRLAREKAEAGFARQQGALVSLGADTIVVCDGEIFGKPRDQAHAIAMLTALSGKAHRVLSAVAFWMPRELRWMFQRPQFSLEPFRRRNALPIGKPASPSAKRAVMPCRVMALFLCRK